MALRKISLFQDTVFIEANKAGTRPITRIAAAGVVTNPFAGHYVEDLHELYDTGERLGAQLTQAAMTLLNQPVESYGKAAIVGIGGDIEHAHAMLHPKLGKQMRDPIGGGEALIPSSAKIGVPGGSLDIPLGHKDNAWSFDHFDAMTIHLSDAPFANELVLVVAFADGGRLNPRCGLKREAE